MNELRPHGRELLARARAELTPTEAERARLLQQLLASARDERETSGAVRSRPNLAARLGLLAALAVAIGLALYWASHAAR